MGYILQTFTRCTRLFLENIFWHHRLGAMLSKIGDFQRRKIITFLKKSIRTMGYIYILKKFPRCARHYFKQSTRKYVRYCIPSWGRCRRNLPFSMGENTFTWYIVFWHHRLGAMLRKLAIFNEGKHFALD